MPGASTPAEALPFEVRTSSSREELITGDSNHERHLPSIGKAVKRVQTDRLRAVDDLRLREACRDTRYTDQIRAIRAHRLPYAPGNVFDGGR
jgi:ribosomal protein L44E